MSNKTYLFAWNPNSEGASELAEAMGIKRIKHQGSRFKGSDKKIVINWGASNIDNPEILKCKVVNHPDRVALCSNKLRFFEELAGKGVTIPDWTTDKKTAFEWVVNGSLVCARTILNGHSAAGLVIMHKDDVKTLVEAPLYTRYVPKKEEYRVHVVKGRTVDVQRKALRNGWVEEHGANVNFRIRNLENGFIYMRQDIQVPDIVSNEARKAVEIMKLDFGAVDVIYNEKNQKAFVLEINTAPGLEGQSIQNYAGALAN